MYHAGLPFTCVDDESGQTARPILSVCNGVNAFAGRRWMVHLNLLYKPWLYQM